MFLALTLWDMKAISWNSIQLHKSYQTFLHIQQLYGFLQMQIEHPHAVQHNLIHTYCD